MKTIKEQFYSFCKIQIEFPNYSIQFGPGFLYKFQKQNTKEYFYTLITSVKVISEKIIEKEEIKIYFNNDNIGKIIKFFESRFCFINKQYGITNYEKEIYILQYKKNLYLFISKGFINKLSQKDNILFYICPTESGSISSPVINAQNNKVIGIQKDSFKKNEKRIGFGCLIKKLVKEYIYFINSGQYNPNLNTNIVDNLNKKIFDKIIQNKFRDEFELIKINVESNGFLGSSFVLYPLINNYNNYKNIKELNNFYKGKFDKYNKQWSGKLIIEKKDRFRLNRFKNIYLKQYMSVCKIETYQNNFCTGFFCKFPNLKKKDFFYTLVTSNHAVSENYITRWGQIKIYLNNNDKLGKTINLDGSRLFWLSELYDITIIEIKEDDGLELNNFLEIDDFENNYNENISKYINNAIYMIQYSIKENKPELFLSKGFINSINKDKKRIFYDCLTGLGASGSPIINAQTNKVIGVHKGRNQRNDIRMGILILFSFKNYINILISNNSINSSLTELILLYEDLNTNKEEDFINNNVDSYEKIFGITTQNKSINGIKLSNILLQSDDLTSSVELNPFINSNKNNYNNIEELDNFYEDNFDDETKSLN